jgi:hypothetical protein
MGVCVEIRRASVSFPTQVAFWSPYIAKLPRGTVNGTSVSGVELGESLYPCHRVLDYIEEISDAHVLVGGMDV